MVPTRKGPLAAPACQLEVLIQPVKKERSFWYFGGANSETQSASRQHVQHIDRSLAPTVLASTGWGHARHFRQASHDQTEAKEGSDVGPEQACETSVDKSLCGGG